MKIAVVGKGRMGQLISQTAKDRGHEVLAMTDCLDPEVLEDRLKEVEVVLDFSHPDNLDWLLRILPGTGTALVEGTTSFQPEQLAALEQAAGTMPIFYSSNYSLGIAVLKDLAARASEVLKEKWDMEIVETHHNKKADAPSGTALSLLEAIDPDQSFDHVFGREGVTGPRGKEIGVHAVRGGTVAGDHEVLFLGPDEKLVLSHSAGSRQIFVNGALDAAEYMKDKPAGLYSMPDLIEQ